MFGRLKVLRVNKCCGSQGITQRPGIIKFSSAAENFHNISKCLAYLPSLVEIKSTSFLLGCFNVALLILKLGRAKARVLTKLSNAMSRIGFTRIERKNWKKKKRMFTHSLASSSLEWSCQKIVLDFILLPKKWTLALGSLVFQMMLFPINSICGFHPRLCRLHRPPASVCKPEDKEDAGDGAHPALRLDVVAAHTSDSIRRYPVL